MIRTPRITLQFSLLMFLAASASVFGLTPVNAQENDSEKKPNIVIIWGDDIGQSNVSAYTRGLMGYQTPNIDSIARDGIMFTDYYGEQSCTAGRASFITGQHGMRTGLTKVGMPGAKAGMQKEDRPSPTCSRRKDTRLRKSARTIWATATNTCRRFMASMNSTAISIT